MVTFTIAVILFFITPGPAVLSVAGVGSAFGSGPGIKYIAGLWVGTNLVAIVIVSGLAATALENRNIQLKDQELKIACSLLLFFCLEKH